MSDHHQGITVDLAAVRSFGAGLHADLTAHLSPEHDQILRTFVDIPSFGARTASPVIQAAVITYQEQLIRLLDLTEAFLDNGAALVQATEDIVAAYQRADEISGQAMQETLRNARSKAFTASDEAMRAGFDPVTGRPI